MAPGGTTYKEALESNWIGLDYEVRMSKVEATNKPAKSASVSIGKIRSSNGSGVHELLECPVCTNLMYPPINQVCVSVCATVLLFLRHSTYFCLVNVDI